MSHERSITVRMGRKYVNIPTKTRDANRTRTMTNRQAIRQAADTGHNLGSYDTLDEAIRAAEERSQAFDGHVHARDSSFVKRLRRKR